MSTSEDDTKTNTSNKEEATEANGTANLSAATNNNNNAGHAASSASASEKPMTDATTSDDHAVTNGTSAGVTIQISNGDIKKPDDIDAKSENGDTKKPASATASVAGSDFVDEDDVDPEEENLFKSLEQQQKEKEMEESLHPSAQPKDATCAPSLLRAALEKGEINAEDSEVESENEAKKAKSLDGKAVKAQVSNLAKNAGGETKEGDASAATETHEHHPHARVSRWGDRCVVRKREKAGLRHWESSRVR